MKKRSPLVLLGIVILIGAAGLAALVLLSFVFSPKKANSFLGEPIAIVKIEGGIFESDDILKELDEYREDDRIKAIVLRINSPGGAVAPSQEIYRQVIKFRESGKKVIVSMGTIAASGGYYIAAAGDKIVASPGTVTGSIGVIMQSFGVKNLVEKFKVEPRVIKSGKLKDTGSPFRDMTDEEKAYLQNLSDNLYHQFVRDVSVERDIPLEDTAKLAEGKIYSGEQAKELKLVDELGNLYDAIALARKEAGLPKDAGVKWPRKPSAFEKFFEENSAQSSLQNLFLKLGTQVIPLWMSDLSDAPLN